MTGKICGATPRANLDVARLWVEWIGHRPKDKRRQWGYVYLADMGHDRSSGQQLWKIGVSVKPWKRVREVRAKSIVVSRWVYRPFALEAALHRTFRVLSPGADDFIARYGFDAFERGRAYIGGHPGAVGYSVSPTIGEEFALDVSDIEFVRRALDFWQLMSPVDHDPRVMPIRVSLNSDPLQGIWEYASSDGRLARILGGR